MKITIDNNTYENVGELKTVNGSTFIHAQEDVIFNIYIDMEEAGHKVYRPDYNPFNEHYYTMFIPKGVLMLVEVE